MLQMLKPQANDLRTKVDGLADLFTLPAELGNGRAKARDAWKHARTQLKAADAELRRVAAQNPPTRGVTGAIDSPKTLEALARRDRAATAVEAARAVLVAATEAHSREFCNVALARLDEAAPVIEEVAELVTDTLQPLLVLHAYALTHGLDDLPRALQLAPRLSDAVRVLTTLANIAADRGRY